MEEKLNEVIPLITKVVDGKDLTAQEAEKVFTDIFLYDKEGYHYLAVCAGLHAKGETADEILGLNKSTEKLAENLTPKISSSQITDLAGTGGGKLKTINVSTAASFVVAGAGYTVAKQSMFGITSPTGSADIFVTFGIEVFELKPNQIEDTLEKVGICPLFTSAISPKLKNRSALARKIFGEKGIRIRSIFNIASFVHSPLPLKRRIYGCYSEEYLEVLGKVFSRLGYDKTLTLHGAGSLPEVSNIGDTEVVEQESKSVKHYTLAPEDFGVEKADVEDIKTGGREKNIIDFLRVIYGQEKGPKRDIVLVNASASLFAMGEVSNFKEGTRIARKIIDEGMASEKLEQLVKELGSVDKLNSWKDKAGLMHN